MAHVNPNYLPNTLAIRAVNGGATIDITGQDPEPTPTANETLEDFLPRLEEWKRRVRQYTPLNGEHWECIRVGTPIPVPIQKERIKSLSFCQGFSILAGIIIASAIAGYFEHKYMKTWT